jgi:hypothetical protein
MTNFGLNMQRHQIPELLSESENASATKQIT